MWDKVEEVWLMVIVIIYLAGELARGTGNCFTGTEILSKKLIHLSSVILVDSTKNTN